MAKKHKKSRLIPVLVVLALFLVAASALLIYKKTTELDSSIGDGVLDDVSSIISPDDLNKSWTELTATSSKPQPKRGFVDDGEYVSKNDDNPFTSVRDYLSGGSANKYAIAIRQGGMRHTVLNVGVRELINVKPGGETTYKAGSLEARIKNAVDWNKANPDKKLTVHLRFNVGKAAPNAWKTACGTVDMTDPNFNVKATVPRWWLKKSDGSYTYRYFYESAMKALGKAVEKINAESDTKNIIGSVNIPAAAPNYPEPMLIYSSSPEVRANLVKAGFTAREHNSFMMWAPEMAKYFPNVYVELALNPYQNINANGDATNRDKDLYKDVANKLISVAGSRTVLANYSIRTSMSLDNAKGNYTEMQNWMIEKGRGKPGVVVGFQMARPQVVSQGLSSSSRDYEQWDNVAYWAAMRGANFVETTGPGSGDAIKKAPGMNNVWPNSYSDDSDDLPAMRRITSKMLSNPIP